MFYVLLINFQPRIADILTVILVVVNALTFWSFMNVFFVFTPGLM